MLVDSSPVAEHIEALLAAGWKKIEIAQAASVSNSLVTKASRPGNGLNQATAEALLALRPAERERPFDEPAREAAPEPRSLPSRSASL